MDLMGGPYELMLGAMVAMMVFVYLYWGFFWGVVDGAYYKLPRFLTHTVGR